MRQVVVGMAIMTLMSINAWAGDREIAEHIISKLKQQRDAGALKGFKVDLGVNNGVVSFTGTVSTPEQRKVVLDTVKGAEGVTKVDDQIKLRQAKATLVQQAPAAALVKPAPAAALPKQALAASKPKPASKPLVSKPLVAKPVIAKPVAKPLVAKSVKPVPASPMPKQPTVKLAANPIPADSKVVSPEAIRQAPKQTQLVGAVEPLKETKVESVKPLPPRAPLAAKPVQIPSVQPEVNPQDQQDRNLNATITKALTAAKKEGRLRGFAMDITTNAGDVWLKGRTITADQRDIVLDVVRRVPGVTNVINDIEVMIKQPAAPAETAVRQASDSIAVAAPQQLRPVPVQAAPAPPQAVQPTMQRAPARFVPVPYRRSTMPQPFATTAQAMPGAGQMVGQPVPMGGGAYGAPGYSQPNLPNYAWPGYSAYPNYAALSYPKQYSPSAWPFIGPFYPYPQVPLNWRKVTLQWDDGWWFLDYSSKSR